jgi:hypothetical protein
MMIVFLNEDEFLNKLFFVAKSSEGISKIESAGSFSSRHQQLGVLAGFP